MFKSQGWSAFISNRTVYRVLYSVHISVGIQAGCATLIVDIVTGPVFGKDYDDNNNATANTANGSHILCFLF